jgi:ABC-type branched-subunit amino acid transport system ATPase component
MAGQEGAYMTLLHVENLQKSFGSLAVTRDVTLNVSAGEKHVIIGPNGAGKTSLINQIGGQIMPDSGAVLIDGADVTRLAPERRAKLGLARRSRRIRSSSVSACSKMSGSACRLDSAAPSTWPATL